MKRCHLALSGILQQLPFVDTVHYISDHNCVMLPQQVCPEVSTIRYKMHAGSNIGTQLDE